MAALSHIHNYKRHFWKDPSLWTLAAINIYFAITAYQQGMANYTMVWLYWSQSLVIGGFNFLRIITLSKFSTKNYRSGDSKTDLPPTPGTKYFTAFFFLCHYGFFHLVYFLFLNQEITSKVYWEFVRTGTELFIVNYAFTFIFQKRWDNTHRPNIGELMFFPYLRVVPIHFTIMLGAFIPGIGIIAFIILKTVIDMIAHVVDNMLREKQDAEELVPEKSSG